MRDVYDFAKYFIKNGADSILCRTRMKIQNVR